MKISAFLRAVTLPAAVLLLTLLLSSPLLARNHPVSGLGTPGSTTPTPASTPTGKGTLFHGITVRLAWEGRVVVATCSYDGGAPVAGGDVTIYRPGEVDPYLIGITDPDGFFAFLPGMSGEWRFVVDDGLGHRREASIQMAAGSEKDVESAPSAEAPDHPGNADRGDGEPTSSPGESPEHTHPDQGAGSDRLWKLATGLSLIFGLTGLAYGVTARRGQM